MGNNEVTGVLFILALLAVIQAVFFIPILMTIHKVNHLEPSVKNRILKIENYMAFAQKLNKNDLIKVSALPDGELDALNNIDDIDELVKSVKAKVKIR